MNILVERSHRPSRWSGVALFACLLAVVLWAERPAPQPQPGATSAHGTDTSPASFSSFTSATAADPVTASDASVGQPSVLSTTGSASDAWFAPQAPAHEVAPLR